MDKDNFMSRVSWRSKYKKRSRWIVGWMICLTVFLAILCSAGNFLIYDEVPQKSDVIIVLSGGNERLSKGVELYKEGYAPYILLTNAVYGITQDPENTLLNQIAGYNLPTQAILLETKAESTYENALFTRPILEKYHFRSAIIVSSNYHMRRVKFNFDRVYRNTSIRLTYCATSSSLYNPNRWWATKKGLLITMNEYVKLLGNACGIHGIAAKQVLNRVNGWIFR
jgi:uncharacterized SAM-binding protein YcdF (DUF218 family)